MFFITRRRFYCAHLELAGILALVEGLISCKRPSEINGCQRKDTDYVVKLQNLCPHHAYDAIIRDPALHFMLR